MSDLHLETPRALPTYSEFRIESTAPYLALLRDIGNIHDSRLFGFPEQQLQEFPIVFYAFGNHEPYHDSFDTQLSTCATAVSAMKEQVDIQNHGDTTVGELVFLNKKRFDISETVTILGCTLFSNIAESQQSTVTLFISDFSNIQGWTVGAHNAAHQEDLEWLNSQVANISRDEPHRRIAILTHYSPNMLLEANDPEHLEDPPGVQLAFVTNLAQEICWTSPKVKVWAFGHTHHGYDFLDSATGKRIVANQRGYGREGAFDFDVGKTIAVTGC
ncbi:Fc.00g080160.m01.CDS01 [Cosmosporella sp. VM-42]